MDADVLWWLVPVAVLVLGTVIVLAVLGRMRRTSRSRPSNDPDRPGPSDPTLPHEASDRASGRNSWMRGGDGG